MEQSDISSSPLTVHTNLWLETNDKVVLSRWRVQLLEAIGETGSIPRGRDTNEDYLPPSLASA